MAYIIFQNTGKFKSDLKNWSRKPEINHKWINMKAYFRNALQDIKDVDDVPVSTTYNQVNMIQQVFDGVRGIVRDQVAETLPSFPTPNYSQYSIPPPHFSRAENKCDHSFLQANAVIAPSYMNTNANAATKHTTNRLSYGA